jgi:hypothetical protein
LLDVQRAGDRSRGGLQGRGRRKQRSTALSYPKLSRNGDRAAKMCEPKVQIRHYWY